MSDDTAATTARRERDSRYTRSEKGRARMRRWFSTPKGQRARFYGHLRERAAIHEAKKGTLQ